MAKVYVSSTVADLKPERQAVIDWLIQARHQPVHSYLPDSETVRDSCLADIDECELYVLIQGYRYGHAPKEDNPDGLSITHLEFRRAFERRIPCVALRTNTPDMRYSDMRDAERYQRVLAFHAEVDAKLRAAEFSNPAELVAALSAGVQNELAKLARKAGGPTDPRPPVPSPALRMPQHTIVGRAALVGQVLDGLARGRREFAFIYLAGVGKTTVAAELIHDKDVAGYFPDGALWAHLGPDPDVRRQLRDWALALGLGEEELENCSGLEDLSEAVAKAIGQRRMLLVVDDVWNTEAGARFRFGGKNCVYVVTTRHPVVARELMPTVEHVITVPKLGDEDGLLLLSEPAPQAAEHAPDMLRELVRRVDGLPIALVLIGNLLKSKGDNKRAIAEVERDLDIDLYAESKLPEFDQSDSISLDMVIEASYKALGKAGSLRHGKLTGDQLREALEALSVLRPDPSWFPVSLAERLMERPEPALDELANAGLIEEVHYPGGDDWENADRRYTMHRVVAEYIRAKLPPERCQALNRLAADYYLARLGELEKAYQEGGATTYSAMYRYENPEWQDCQDNWLYHFAQTGYDREASLSFLKVWFDGFWWWSCFTDEGFDFCDQLLVEWEHRLTLAGSASGSASSSALSSPPSQGRIERRAKGLDLLRRFKRAYPKETQDRRSGDWPEVADTIRTLRSLSSLDGEIGQLTQPSARHVRALTDIFLAEAERFGGGDLVAAEAYYREAQALFRVDHDDWNVAWSLYHLADMLADQGRHAETPPLCEEALGLGRAGGDHEVVALAHRVLGDAAFAGHDAVAAVRNYRLAAEYAYRFQVEPTDPDDYTLQFYADMTRALAERLLRGHEREPELAREIALGLRRAWTDHGIELPAPAREEAMWVGGGAGTLAAWLFPAPLEPERRQDENTYAQTVRGHLKAIGA